MFGSIILNHYALRIDGTCQFAQHVAEGLQKSVLSISPFWTPENGEDVFCHTARDAKPEQPVEKASRRLVRYDLIDELFKSRSLGLFGDN